MRHLRDLTIHCTTQNPPPPDDDDDDDGVDHDDPHNQGGRHGNQK